MRRIHDEDHPFAHCKICPASIAPICMCEEEDE